MNYDDSESANDIFILLYLLSLGSNGDKEKYKHQLDLFKRLVISHNALLKQISENTNTNVDDLIITLKELPNGQ